MFFNVLGRFSFAAVGKFDGKCSYFHENNQLFAPFFRKTQKALVLTVRGMRTFPGAMRHFLYGM